MSNKYYILTILALVLILAAGLMDSMRYRRLLEAEQAHAKQVEATAKTALDTIQRSHDADATRTAERLQQTEDLAATYIKLQWECRAADSSKGESPLPAALEQRVRALEQGVLLAEKQSAKETANALFDELDVMLDAGKGSSRTAAVKPETLLNLDAAIASKDWQAARQAAQSPTASPAERQVAVTRLREAARSDLDQRLSAIKEVEDPSAGCAQLEASIPVSVAAGEVSRLLCAVERFRIDQCKRGAVRDFADKLAKPPR